MGYMLFVLLLLLLQNDLLLAQSKSSQVSKMPFIAFLLFLLLSLNKK